MHRSRIAILLLVVAGAAATGFYIGQCDRYSTAAGRIQKSLEGIRKSVRIIKTLEKDDPLVGRFLKKTVHMSS